MLISLFRYIQGYLKIRVTGYSPERFLNLCKNKKIAVWGLESRHNAYEMYMKISGFRKLKPILKKTQTKVTIEERFGLPFFFHKYRKRKLFFVGISLCVLLIYSMTFFIWNIDLQGNQSITNEVLLEYLETQEITHGMAKHKVNCEQIAKDIRKNFDDIIWVSASLEGTRLHIHVKENMDTFKEPDLIEEPSDIVSDKLGIVKSIVTRSGVPQVKAGDEVTEGMVLVSGTVDVLNDAKEVVSHRYVVADADIILETATHYHDSLKKRYEKKVYTDKKRQLAFLKIGDYTLQFGWQKNKFEHYETQTTEMQMKLGENFYLPLFPGSKKIKEYKLEPMEYSKEEMETLLKDKFEQYCKNLEESGAVILENNLQILHENTGAEAKATIISWESVGIRRKIVDF